MVVSSSSSDDESASRNRKSIREEFLRRRRRRLLKRRLPRKPSHDRDLESAAEESDLDAETKSKNRFRTSSPKNVPIVSTPGPNATNRSLQVPENHLFSFKMHNNFKFPHLEQRLPSLPLQTPSIWSPSVISSPQDCQRGPFVFNTPSHRANVSESSAPQNLSLSVPVLIGMTPDCEIFDPFTLLPIVLDQSFNHAEDSATTVSVASAKPNDSFDTAVTSISQILQNESSVLVNSSAALTPLHQTTDPSITHTSHDLSIDPASISVTSLPHSESVNPAPETITPTSHSQSFNSEANIIEPPLTDVEHVETSDSEPKGLDPSSNTLAETQHNLNFERNFNSSAPAQPDQSLDLTSISFAPIPPIQNLDQVPKSPTSQFQGLYREAKLNASTQKSQNCDAVCNNVSPKQQNQNFKPTSDSPPFISHYLNIDFSSIYVPNKYAPNNLNLPHVQSFDPELTSFDSLSNRQNQSLEPTFNSSALALHSQSNDQASISIPLEPQNQNLDDVSKSAAPTSQDINVSSEAKLDTSTQQRQIDGVSNAIANIPQNQNLHEVSNSVAQISQDKNISSDAKSDASTQRQINEASNAVTHTPLNQSSDPVSMGVLNSPPPLNDLNIDFASIYVPNKLHSQSFNPEVTKTDLKSDFITLKPKSQSFHPKFVSSDVLSNAHIQCFEPTFDSSALIQHDAIIDPPSLSISLIPQNQNLDKLSNSVALKSQDGNVSFEVKLDASVHLTKICNGVSNAIVHTPQNQTSDMVGLHVFKSPLVIDERVIDLDKPHSQIINFKIKENDPATDLVALTPQSQSFHPDFMSLDVLSNSHIQSFDPTLNSSALAPHDDGIDLPSLSISSMVQNQNLDEVSNSVAQRSQNKNISSEVKFDASTKKSQTCNRVLNDFTQKALNQNDLEGNPDSKSLNADIKSTEPTSDFVELTPQSQSLVSEEINFDPIFNSSVITQLEENDNLESKPRSQSLNSVTKKNDSTPNSVVHTSPNQSIIPDIGPESKSSGHTSLSQNLNAEAKPFVPSSHYVADISQNQSFQPIFDSSELTSHDQSIDPASISVVSNSHSFDSEEKSFIPSSQTLNSQNFDPTSNLAIPLDRQVPEFDPMALTSPDQSNLVRNFDTDTPRNKSIDSAFNSVKRKGLSHIFNPEAKIFVPKYNNTIPIISKGNSDPKTNYVAQIPHSENFAARTQFHQSFHLRCNSTALVADDQSISVTTEQSENSALEFDEFVLQNQNFNRASSPVALSPRNRNVDPASSFHDSSSNKQSIDPEIDSVTRKPLYKNFYSTSNAVDQPSYVQSFYTASNSIPHPSHIESFHSASNDINQSLSNQNVPSEPSPVAHTLYSQSFHTETNPGRHASDKHFHSLPDIEGHPLDDQNFDPLAPIHKLPPHIQRFFSAASSVSPPHRRNVNLASKPVENPLQNENFNRMTNASHNHDLNPTSDFYAQIKLLSQIERFHSVPNVVAPVHNKTFPTASNPIDNVSQNKSFDHGSVFNYQPPRNASDFAEPHSPCLGPTSNVYTQMQLLTEIKRFHAIPNVVAPLHNEILNHPSNSVNRVPQNNTNDVSAQMQHDKNFEAASTLSEIQRFHSTPNVIAPPYSENLNSIDLRPHFSGIPQHNQNRNLASHVSAHPIKPVLSRIHRNHWMHNENFNLASDPVEDAPQNNSFNLTPSFNGQLIHNMSNSPTIDFSGEEPKDVIPLHDQTLCPESSLDTSSIQSLKLDLEYVRQPQTQGLDVTNMPRFVTRVRESENYEQISSFNAFSPENQRYTSNSTFGSVKMPHSENYRLLSSNDNTYNQHNRNLDSAATPVINTVPNRNFDRRPGLDIQPPQNLNFNLGPNFNRQLLPNQNVHPGLGFVGQPPQRPNFNPGPNFNGLPSNENIYPGFGFMGQPPRNPNFNPGANFNRQPQQNLNLNPGPGFIRPSTQNQNFNMRLDFNGRPFPNENVHPGPGYMRQPPPNLAYIPRLNFNEHRLPNQNVHLGPDVTVPPPQNQNLDPGSFVNKQPPQILNLGPNFNCQPQENMNFNPEPGFNRQPVQNEIFNMEFNFNVPPPQNKMFVGHPPQNHNFNPVLGFNEQPVHLSPTFNNLSPPVQRFFAATDSITPPNQNLNLSPNSVHQAQQNQTFNRDSDGKNSNSVSTSNEEPEPGTLEYYLDLPKTWFPTPRMMTLDPNPIIDEICKLDDIILHTDWILDLEFGFPRAPPNKPLAVYDARHNSIQRVDNIEFPHPDYERCSKEFKQVLMFYYDCVIIMWYRGYMLLTNDDSLENFHEWLKVPLQKIGMCW